MLCLGLTKSLALPRCKLTAQCTVQHTNVQSWLWYTQFEGGQLDSLDETKDVEILLGRCPTRANFNLTPILRPIEKEEKSWKLFYFVFDRNAWNEDCTHAGKAGRGHLPPRENLKCLRKWWILGTTSVPPPPSDITQWQQCVTLVDL